MSALRVLNNSNFFHWNIDLVLSQKSSFLSPALTVNFNTKRDQIATFLAYVPNFPCGLTMIIF